MNLIKLKYLYKSWTLTISLALLVRSKGFICSQTNFKMKAIIIIKKHFLKYPKCIFKTIWYSKTFFNIA